MLVERGACYGIIVAARPAPLLCVVVAAVVLLYIYLICNTSSAQNTGWVTTAASAYLLRGINCNYLVLIGPCHQLGAAGHQDTSHTALSTGPPGGDERDGGMKIFSRTSGECCKWLY